MANIPDNIKITPNPDRALKSAISALNPDKIMVLADENTAKFCLPELRSLALTPKILIQAGEKFKDIDSTVKIWHEMTQYEMTRKSLLLNLGGGVIGDMGGFAASTFKRGIRFLNVPTTLLSMVDASIGGKLAIDFEGLKNHIGVFKNPEYVIISSMFLKTLPENELLSGWAEVLKHGLISDKNYWEQCRKESPLEFGDINGIIEKSVELKNHVVMTDPHESGFRKILNFGHTVGHAIESWNIKEGNLVTHGECVVAGMIFESHISLQKNMISSDEMNEIARDLSQRYRQLEIPKTDQLISIMQQDKKNVGANISFSLLEKVGNAQFDQPASTEQISKAYQFYLALYK